MSIEHQVYPIRTIDKVPFLLKVIRREELRKRINKKGEKKGKTERNTKRLPLQEALPSDITIISHTAVGFEPAETRIIPVGGR